MEATRVCSPAVSSMELLRFGCTIATGMITFAPSSTCRSEAILLSSCRPYDSSDSEEKVISRRNMVGEGRGDSACADGWNLGCLTALK